MKKKFFIWSILVGTMSFPALGQLTNPNQLNGRELTLNTITTAVPFLTIAPDSRCGAMGDAGVALDPDASATYWNPSKLAFVEDKMEFSLSYSPWLRALVNDMSLSYLSGYKRLNKNQTIGGSLRYFTLGNITFTDEMGSVIMPFKPAEFAVDFSFAQKLSKSFSGGLAIRYVNSNLTGRTNVQGAESKPGQTVAVDVSTFYTNDKLRFAGKKAKLNWGLNLSNIGAKMSYTNTDYRDFIPANLRTGVAFTTNMDQYNKLTFLFDLNKLLVPSPPIYKNNSDTILSGFNPNVGTATGIIQSFYDAPGQYDPETGTIYDESKFREELREYNIATGIEYDFAKQFAVRLGYFHEHYTKGNRQFITFGAGLHYQVLTIDMSYLVSTTQQNPLANTLRFTLRFSLDGSARNESESEP
ncbi:MAG: type IX secretion system outer membrane channel protein PorV [Bacteroidota bacterium]